MFYYTLGNIRPELHSTRRNIQLILCVSCPILQKYECESMDSLASSGFNC